MYKTVTASSPFIEVNVKLSPQEMLLLIHGLKYVIPCQSRFSRLSVDQWISRQLERLSSVVKNCLRDHQMSVMDDRAKQAFSALQELLKQSYSKTIPVKLWKRMTQEWKVLRRFLRMLKNRPDILIRRTDKCKVFYIGRADDFARKTEEYMSKTEAYEELTHGRCPLAEIIHAVQSLLNYLFSKNALTRKQCQMLCPKAGQLELAHYHGLPKPHKVMPSFCFERVR